MLAQAEVYAGDHGRCEMAARVGIVYFGEKSACTMGISGEGAGVSERCERFDIARVLRGFIEGGDRFFDHAIFNVNAAEAEVGGEEARLLFEQSQQVVDGAMVLAREKVRVGSTHVEHERERIEFAGAALRGLGFVEAAHGVEVGSVPMECGGVAGIEFDGAKKFFLGAGPIPFVPEASESERSMRLAKGRINFDGLRGRSHGFWAGYLRRECAEPAKEAVAIGDAGERTSATAFDGEGRFEGGYGFFQGFLGALAKKEAAAKIGLVGRGVKGKASGRFFGKQFESEGAAHLTGDISLDTENVAEFAIVTGRPKMSLVGGFDELDGDANARAFAADGAFEDVSDFEFSGDFRDRFFCIFILNCGSACDDAEALGIHLAEVGDEFLGKAFGEIFAVGGAQNFKGENGEHFFGGRSVRGRWNAFGFDDGSNETVTEARKSFDETRALRGIAE